MKLDTVVLMKLPLFRLSHFWSVTLFFSVCTLGQKSKNEHAEMYTYGWKAISEVQDLSG